MPVGSRCGDCYLDATRLCYVADEETMKKTIVAILLLMLTAPAWFASQSRKPAAVPVVLISIDGLKPD